MAADALGVTKTVLLEVEWVLRGAYGYDRKQVNDGLRRLVGLDTLDVEGRPCVLQALTWRVAGMDFADALHLASSGTASSFATFDRGLGKTAVEVGASPPVDVL